MYFSDDNRLEHLIKKTIDTLKNVIFAKDKVVQCHSDGGREGGDEENTNIRYHSGQPLCLCMTTRLIDLYASVCQCCCFMCQFVDFVVLYARATLFTLQFIITSLGMCIFLFLFLSCPLCLFLSLSRSRSLSVRA